jgi:hypothetical protein
VPGARREVARLEDVLTIAPRPDSGTIENERIAPETAAAALPEVEAARTETADTTAEGDAAPTDAAELRPSADARPAEPIHVAAAALREAFWFEQASAFQSDGAGEATTRPAPEPDMPKVESVRPPAHSATSDVERRNPWLVALCLLALIGLVVVLTGRSPRAKTD